MHVQGKVSRRTRLPAWSVARAWSAKRVRRPLPLPPRGRKAIIDTLRAAAIRHSRRHCCSPLPAPLPFDARCRRCDSPLPFAATVRRSHTPQASARRSAAFVESPPLRVRDLAAIGESDDPIYAADIPGQANMLPFALPIEHAAAHGLRLRLRERHALQPFRPWALPIRVILPSRTIQTTPPPFFVPGSPNAAGRVFWPG